MNGASVVRPRVIPKSSTLIRACWADNSIQILGRRSVRGPWKPTFPASKVQLNLDFPDRARSLLTGRARSANGGNQPVKSSRSAAGPAAERRIILHRPPLRRRRRRRRALPVCVNISRAEKAKTARPATSMMERPPFGAWERRFQLASSGPSRGRPGMDEQPAGEPGGDDRPPAGVRSARRGAARRPDSLNQPGSPLRRERERRDGSGSGAPGWHAPPLRSSNRPAPRPIRSDSVTACLNADGCDLPGKSAESGCRGRGRVRVFRSPPARGCYLESGGLWASMRTMIALFIQQGSALEGHMLKYWDKVACWLGRSCGGM